MPPRKKVELSFVYVHVHCNAKNYVFIAILSELHAPWQPVMQCYVIGLTTLKHILGNKRIFPCSFGNKRMCLLTCVYGS